MATGLRIARLPAEAPRPFPQARNESAAAEGMPCLGVDLGFVPNTQLDGVQPARDGQLVHRRFQRVHAGTLSWRAHPRGRWHIEPCKPVGSRAVWCRVHPTWGEGGLLGEFLKGRGLLNDIMCDRCQPTIIVCPKADTLDRGRAI